MRQIVINYLEDEPLFRERKNKDKGIVNLLMNRYSAVRHAIQEGIIDKATFVAAVQDYASMDRAWRQALEYHPSLRGNDYDDKRKLEEERQLSLGYVPGHERNIKRLSKIL